ncbi:MAG: trigger factor [Treponema sp.]|nr:trigger factor [Treponema sp.]
MTVSKEITRLEHSGVKLTITVPSEDVQSGYNGLLSEYTKSIQMPGFRKGKVPRDVLIRKFGDALKGEALQKIIEEAMGSVFEDESFSREDRPLPYSTPAVQDEPKLELGQDLCFSVVYDVLPKVTPGTWQGLEVEVPDAAVGEEDLVRELEAVRERNAIVMDKDEGAAALEGDVVTLNYCELDDAGGVIQGTERQDFVFTLGSGYNIYKFDDEIKGMKKGETRDFSKTYPEDFDNKDMAGKTRNIRVTLTALKSKNLPDLDDDLAQDVDEKYRTLEELKAGIRERLEKNLERRLREIKINKLLEKIMETTPVDIPESMIRIELDSRWRNLARRFNTDSDGLYRMMGTGSEKVRSILDEWRPDAVRALHSRLIVETLIENLNIEVSDEELEKDLENQAAENGETPENIKNYYEQNQMKEYLREDIKERKLYDRLFVENPIKLGEKAKYLDLISING